MPTTIKRTEARRVMLCPMSRQECLRHDCALFNTESSLCGMNDLISRVEAVRALASSNGDYLDALERIEKIPAVDAVPVVHARWILVQNGSGVCSVCNRNDHIDLLAAYCRYCGAKMDGERRDGT